MTFFMSKLPSPNLTSAAELVGSGLFASLILSASASLVIYLFMPFVTEYWININKVLPDQTTLAFQIVVIGIVPSVVANTFKGILEGRSQFREANLCKILSGASVFIAPLIVVAYGSKSLIDISLAIVATRYFVLMLYFYYVHNIVDLTSIRLSSTTLHKLYSYGSWAALAGFISTMFVYGDRFIVAPYLSAESLSIYIASQDVLIRYLLIPWSIAIVLMPVFASGNLNQSETINLYQKKQKFMVVLSLIVTFAVLFLAMIVKDYLEHFGVPVIASDVVMIQMIGVFFCSISQLPLIYIYALGNTRLIAIIYILEAMLYILLAPIIFDHYGIYGASLVWSTRLIIEYFLLSYFAQRLMK